MSAKTGVTFRNIIPSHDARPASPFGADITPGNNAYGTYVEVMSGAQLTHDVWELIIRFHDIDSSALAMDMLATVGIDTTGGSTYTDLINHLICTYAGPYSTGGHVGVEYVFRIHIPAGSSIAVKASANNAAPIHLRCSMIAFCNPDKEWLLWKGTFVRTYGATTASSSGTVVTPGTVAEGAWTLLGTLADTIYDWQSGMGVNDATIAAANAYHVDLGVDTLGDAVPRVVILNQKHGFTTAEASSRSTMGGRFKGIAGDKVYGRMQCSTAADSAISQIAYGTGGTYVKPGIAAATIAGTVTVGGAAAPNGKTVEVYAVDADNNAELVTTTTTAGGAGGFTVDVYEATRSYFTRYEDGANVGCSAYGLAEVSTFNISIGSGGGADSTPPVISVTSPTPGAAPGAAGAFSRDYAIAKDTPIVIPVVDAANAVAFVSISVKFSDRKYTEEIYAGSGGAGWDDQYVTGSGITGTGLAGVGYTFTIRRKDGWPPGPNSDGTPLTANVKVRAMDNKGNVIL